MDYPTTLPNGVLTAALTPLNQDLSVNYAKLIAHCQWLLSNGSDGLALLGTTGEANSFSVEERIAVMNEVKKGGIPVEKVMVGTGCCALPDTTRLTKHAVELGYGGVLMLPPFYYKPLTPKGLIAYFEQIIHDVGNSLLRIYLYHIPHITGVPYPVSLVQELVEKFPETVVGMKDSSGDWENMKTICETLPDFKLYAGTEKFLLNVLQVGGAGCISATANATTQLAHEVYMAWQNGADASALQERLVAVRKGFEGFVFVSGLKSMFAKWHKDPSWLHVRPPNVVLDEAQLAELQQKMESLAFSLP